MARASSYTGYRMRARTAEPDGSGSWSLESFHAATNDMLSTATTDGLTWSLLRAVGTKNSSPTGTPVGRRIRPHTSHEPGPVGHTCQTTISAPSPRAATPNAWSDAKSDL